MPEQTKDSLLQLIRVVDTNFKSPGYSDIFAVFPLPFILIGFMIIAISVALTVSPNMLSAVWVPILFSLAAFFASFYSFNMASRKYANKRLASREAKRIVKFLITQVDDADCLLPPLVALKMENYHIIKLERLYEMDKELFRMEKLSEYYKST